MAASVIVGLPAVGVYDDQEWSFVYTFKEEVRKKNQTISYHCFPFIPKPNLSMIKGSS